MRHAGSLALPKRSTDLAKLSTHYATAFDAFGGRAELLARALGSCAEVEEGDSTAFVRPAPWDSEALERSAFGLEAITCRDGLKQDGARRLVEKLMAYVQDQKFEFGFTTIAASCHTWDQALAFRDWRRVSTLITVGGPISTLPLNASPMEELDDLRSEDAEEVVRIGAAAVTDGRMFTDQAIPRHVAERFYSRFANSLHRGVVGGDLFGRAKRVGDKLAGFAVGRVDDLATELTGRRFGYLWLIAVDPTAQGSGVGRALLSDFLALASDRMEVLEVSTQATNKRAINLYLRAGLPFVGAMHQLHWHAR